ncbi:MAG: hypothetical protein MJ214_01960 [Bacilli bacterium]|nr:hypothetical protein [Bacilli bacterium]
MKKIIQHTLNKSTLPDYYEVVITFIDDDGINKQETVFVTSKLGESNQYYIDEAKRYFENKYHLPSTTPRRRLKFKGKPLAITIASVVLVVATVTGITLGVVLSNQGGGAIEKDEFDKMHDYYTNYIINNVKIDYYKDLSADQIMNHVYWKDDSEGQPIFTTIKTTKIAGVETYYLDGINYNDGTNRDIWPAATHVGEARAIAAVATIKNDPKIMDIATKMTYFWVYNNFRSTNWWHNELGAGANTLADLGLFTYDHMNDQGKAMLVSKVANASFYYRPSLLTHSGTNLFDYADITLRSSIFTRNKEEFNLAVKRIEDEINVLHKEGFQQDGSFFQHGQQVQIASYGKEGIIRMAKVLRAISSTGHKFPREKMQILERFVLRGLRDMTHKGYINYSATCRQYCRKNNLKTSENNFNGLSEYILLPDFEKNEELQQYLDNLDQGKSTFSGIEYFDNAHMIAANLNDLYISFKGTDWYLTNTECVNEENRLGLNLSYGTNTCVMDKGNEYDDISPVWNYAYIPGTTSINLNDANVKIRQPNEDFTHPEYNDSALIKMARNEYYKDELFESRLPEKIPDGICAYGGGTYSRPTLTNEAFSWSMQGSTHHSENTFAVGCVACRYGLICVGANLSYTGSVTKDLFFSITPRKLHTTIEQCLYDPTAKGEYELSLDNKTLRYGNALYKIIPDIVDTTEDDKITVVQPHIKLTGAWGRNRNPTEEEKLEVTEEDVLLAYINHGNAFDGNGAPIKYKYAYSIQPASINSNVEFKVVNNLNDEWNVQEILIINADKNETTDIVLPYGGPQPGSEGYTLYVKDKQGQPIKVKLTKGEMYAKTVSNN